LVNLTRAYLRKAELGFLGVIVATRVHTPRFCGEETLVTFFCKVLIPRLRAGALVFQVFFSRLDLTNWLIVGMSIPPFHIAVCFEPTQKIL